MGIQHPKPSNTPHHCTPPGAASAWMDGTIWWCDTCEARYVVEAVMDRGILERQWVRRQPAPSNSWEAQAADVEVAAAAVVQAWTEPGPCPPVHHQAIKELHEKWPTLAVAVERLARAAGNNSGGQA